MTILAKTDFLKSPKGLLTSLIITLALAAPFWGDKYEDQF